MARKNFRATGGIDIDTSAIPTSIIQETITSNSATTVDTIALNSFLAAEYTVTLIQGSKIRTSKVIMQTDGSSVDMTEFAITETGGTMSGVVVSATTASTNAILQVTVTDAASTLVRYKLVRNITTIVGYAPDAPTNVVATAAGYAAGTLASASVTFDAPVDIGNSNITSYTAVSTPGNIAASSSSSPITVTGLTSSISYTFDVTATNSFGTSAATTSNSITTDGPPTLTGGILASDATFYYRSFPSSGTLSLSGSNVTADALIIAGGGSWPGNTAGGGGGAGGLLYQSSISLTAGTYTVTVGAGGSPSSNGSNSVFNSLTAIGGGRGASDSSGAGIAGGSGGGGSGAGGGAGTSGQGNSGGSATWPQSAYRSGGGGGGAGAVGGDKASFTNSAGSGGNGLSTYSSWGVATGYGHNVSGTFWFAGGGGGGPAPQGARGGGGLGGGAGSGVAWGTVNGLANTGGGAGATTGFTGGTGGSGIVIIRYTRAQVGG